MEDSPGRHFTTPSSLGDNPFQADDGRHVEWETFSADAIAALSRLISSLRELANVSDAASYEEWRLRYAELAPPAEYELAWVSYMVNEDQTQWISGRFTKLLLKAFDLFIHGPGDLDRARQIVQCLATAMFATMEKEIGYSRVTALVDQWKGWHWPTKGQLRRHFRNVNLPHEIFSTVRTAESSDRASDVLEDPDGLPYWRADTDSARKCPAFLRPAKAARLDAIGILRKKVADIILNAKPQTRDDLERCLISGFPSSTAEVKARALAPLAFERPAFVEYAVRVLDRMAESKLTTIRPGRTEAYGRWLRSECLPAVVGDVCRPISGQFLVTLRYVGEKIREVDRPEEIVRMRATLLKTWADEMLGGPVTKRLKNYLSMTLQEENIPIWEARAIQQQPVAVPSGVRFQENATSAGIPNEPASGEHPAPATEDGSEGRDEPSPPASGPVASGGATPNSEGTEAEMSEHQSAAVEVQSEADTERDLGRDSGVTGGDAPSANPQPSRPAKGNAQMLQGILAEQSGEQQAAKAEEHQSEQPANTRIPLSLLLREAEGRTADPKLRKKLAAVLRYNRYFEDLKALKTACKRYQTRALLEQQFPDLDVWSVMDSGDKDDIAKGAFNPGHFAWVLVMRLNNLKGNDDRTLKNYRKALKDAGLM